MQFLGVETVERVRVCTQVWASEREVVHLWCDVNQHNSKKLFDKRKELEEWWWSAVCFLVILAICSTQQRELDLFRSSWPFMMHSNVNYSLSMSFSLIARMKHIHDSPADSLASIWCSRRTYYIMSRIALYLNFVEKQLQTIVHRKTIIRRFLWRSIECFFVTHRKWQKNVIDCAS